MKLSKGLFIGVLSLTMLLTSCGEKEIELLGITISSENAIASVVEGDTIQLTATVHPEGAPTGVTWSSSDEELATISQTGLVTTLTHGNVFLYATSTVVTTIRGEFALQITADPNPDPQSISVVSSTGVSSLAIGQTLQLTHTVLPLNSSQEVTWSSDDEEVATVSQTGLVSGVSIGEVVITATSDASPSISGNIDLTVTEILPPDPTIEWDEIDFATHAEFMAAEDNEPLKIKGKVWQVAPVEGSGHEATVNYYIQNGTEGFYIYGQNNFFYPVELNKEYIVGGFKKFYYQGAHEIVDVELFEEIEEGISVTINDISEMSVMNNSVMAPYHASYVQISSGTISAMPSSFASAYSVEVNVGGSVIAYRVDPKVCGTTEFANISAAFQQMAIGSELSAKGVMSAFGYGSVKSNQLLIVKADDIVGQTMDNSTAVQLASEGVVLENTIEFDESLIALPATVTGFDGVNVTWASDNPAIESNGAVSRPTNDVDVVLTGTFKKGEAEVSRDFIVTVLGSDQSNQTEAHSLDFEDALPAASYSTSASQPSYNHEASNNLATLGTPAAEWHYGRTLIGQDSGDRRNGGWAARMQSDKTVQANSGRLELRDDFVFDFLEFNVCTYGSDALNGKLEISYSTDEGANWTALDRQLIVSSRSFELCRVYIPTEGQEARVAISLLVDGLSRRINLDDIRLVRVGE